MAEGPQHLPLWALAARGQLFYVPGLTRTRCLLLNRDSGGKNLPFPLIYLKAMLAFWLPLRTLVLTPPVPARGREVQERCLGPRQGRDLLKIPA